MKIKYNKREYNQVVNAVNDLANTENNHNFAADFAARAASREWYQFLNGNTICEINVNDGTQIMTTKDNEFNLAFPVNIDVNISNKCAIGCPFCYQGCTPKGQEADLIKFLRNKKSFLYTLKGGTELAINGNEPLHPDLIKLLRFCKKRNIFANLTVNEKTFLTHEKLISSWMQKGLIHGLGISPSLYSKKMIAFASTNPNVVVHTIVGVTTKKEYLYLFSNHIKVLVLGYKLTGRGISFRKDNLLITKNKNNLKLILQALADDIYLVSFDNLAIQQLDPKRLLNIPDEEYATLFRGNDGHHTMFINMVTETYAINSVQSKKNHKPLVSSIEEMFADVKTQAEA